MPLDAYHPVRVPGPFHAFDRPVAGPCTDAQVLAGFVDGLMMAAVDGRLGPFAEPRKQGALQESRPMLNVAFDRPWSLGGKIRGPMGNRSGPLRGYVLDQRPLQIDVQDLTAVADREHRLPGSECMVQHGDVGRVSICVHLVYFLVLSSAVTSGIDIRRTAREHKSIESTQLFLKPLERLLQGDFERLGAGPPDRLEVIVKLLPN